MLGAAAPRPVPSLVVVGVADLEVSADPGATLVTYALGSCLGVTVHDPVARVAGLLHVMLPTSELDRERARQNPARFVDTGLPLLFRRCYALGARKERMVTHVVGGARMTPGGRPDRFQIGKRNHLALKQLMWRNGVMVSSEEVGGNVSRTVFLEVGTGEVRVKSAGAVRVL